MTVAEALRDKLRWNMMINHDSIEVSDRIFGFATPAQSELSGIIRENVFSLAVKYDVDLIFTYVCAFEMDEEREYLTGLRNMFEASGGSFYLAELSADLRTRLERNQTPHRMEMKASKRDIAWSRENLLRDNELHRLNSNEGEYWFDNHIKIDNTFLSPEEAAGRIISAFGLVPNEREESEYRFGV